MKKTNILKILMTLVLAFVITGAFAQGYPTTIETDYEEATVTTYQTENLGLTLYVAPDTAYNPTYDGTNPGVIDANSYWRWSYGATVGANVYKDWTAQENYVVIDAADLPAGDNTITWWAQERYSTGCADATGQSHVITVIPEPDGTMIGANTGGIWTEISAGTGREFYTCDPTTVNDDDFTFTFTEGAVSPSPEFKPQITVTRTGYDGDDVIVSAETDVTGTYGENDAATGLVVGDFDAAPTFAISTPLLYTTDGTNNVKTKYVFTLEGVASRISTLSHYRQDGDLTGNAYYTPTVPQTVTYWLYLPPVTGPIYHIPNDFNF